MRLRTQDVKSAHEMPGLNNLSHIGMKYLLPREELIAQISARRKLIEEAAKAIAPAMPTKAATKPPESVSEPASTKSLDMPKLAQQSEQSRKEIVHVPASIELPNISVISDVKDIKVEREHRRLQHLVKKLAEQSGYKATIEQPTDDGQGRIDVGLESDSKRIACEICVTTSPEHELQNIRKCLDSKYDIVILCSPDKKALRKVKSLSEQELAESDLQRVQFLEPEALDFFFEEEAAKSASKTTRIKGYKVKVNFQSQQESEKLAKRKAITKVVLNSLTRDKSTE
jgi:hypothetical protein